MWGVAACVAALCCAARAGAGAAAGSGYRVLVVFPLAGRSHSIVGHSVVDILLADGHEVTYVTAFPRRSDNPRLKHVDISSVAGAVAESERLDIAQLALRPRAAHAILRIGPAFMRRALLHPAVRALLHDTGQSFDLVVAEWFYSGLLAPLAALFACPLVWYSAADASWQTLALVHAPSSAAYTAELQSRAAAPVSLPERAHQLWLQLWLSGWKYYVTKFIEEPAYEELYGEALRRRRGGALPAYSALVHNASLLLLNAHPPLGQRLPLPPSAVYVGGHHVTLPPEPLPQNLQKLLDEAENGAIFFSMGSNLKSKDFPAEMKRELVRVLGQLEQTVLWKFEEPLEDLPRNLHVLDWAPQISILSHPNTMVFVSHGGLLSLTEATLCGVPVVGVPLFGDQAVNLQLAAARGVAILVDFAPDLPAKVKAAVNEILGNYSYRRNAREAARQFAQRPAPAAAALAHALRLAVETRGAPHLRSPALALPAYQRLFLDLLLLLLVAIYLLVKAFKFLKQCLFTSASNIDKKKKNK